MLRVNDIAVLTFIKFIKGSTLLEIIIHRKKHYFDNRLKLLWTLHLGKKHLNIITVVQFNTELVFFLQTISELPLQFIFEMKQM